MADTTKTTNQFKAVAGFTDGDDRTITIDEPITGLAKSNFDSLNAAEVLIGDKKGAAFEKWKSGAYVQTTIVYYDLATV